MDEPRRSVRYRGYRPPPLWWLRLKYLAGMAVFALSVMFAGFQVVHALLTGEVPSISSRSNSSIAWSSAPWRFAWQLFLWLGVGLLSSGGFCLLHARFKGLDGPSAETRL